MVLEGAGQPAPQAKKDHDALERLRGVRVKLVAPYDQEPLAREPFEPPLELLGVSAPRGVRESQQGPRVDRLAGEDRLEVGCDPRRFALDGLIERQLLEPPSPHVPIVRPRALDRIT